MARTVVYRRWLDQLRCGAESNDEQSVGNGTVCIASGYIGKVIVLGSVNAHAPEDLF